MIQGSHLFGVTERLYKTYISKIFSYHTCSFKAAKAIWKLKFGCAGEKMKEKKMGLMKQFTSSFSIWEISIVGAKFTKGLRRSVHLVLLYCHLLGRWGDSIWCPDISDFQTLSWSCKESSWCMQDTPCWRGGSAAEDRSSLSSTSLRYLIAPEEHWSVMWQCAFPQHAMGPFHRESAQDIQAFLTNL